MNLMSLMTLLVLSGSAPQFGDTIPEGATAQPLAGAVAAYTADDAEARVYSGRVGKVCQAKGCWLQLIDGDITARVKTDHKFFFPKDLSGQAQVLGKLVRIELDAEQAEHYAKESNDGSKPGFEYQIKTTGVAMTEG